jgi:hypothetical protein
MLQTWDSDLFTSGDCHKSTIGEEYNNAASSSFDSVNVSSQPYTDPNSFFANRSSQVQGFCGTETDLNVCQLVNKGISTHEPHVADNSSSSNIQNDFQNLTDVSRRAVMKRSQGPVRPRTTAKAKSRPSPYTSSFFENLSTKVEQSEMMAQSEIVQRYMSKSKGNKKNKTDAFLRDVPPNPRKRKR